MNLTDRAGFGRLAILATLAMSMGPHHATALPCTAAIWLEGTQVKLAMLEPSAIFGIFFRDAPLLAFARNALLPGQVSDQIRRALTRELDQQPGQVVGKPAWYAWGQLRFDDDLGEQEGEPIPSQFRVQRLRFGTTGLATPSWQYHFMVDANTEGVRLLHAWIDWNLHEALHLRFGQFKHVFGREHLPAANLWKFHDTSYVVEKLGGKLGRQGGAYRDIGVMAHGKVGLGPVGLNYEAFLMQGNGINALEADAHKDVSAHLGLTLPLGFSLGGSFYQGTIDQQTVLQEIALDQVAAPTRTDELGEQAFGVDLSWRNERIWLQGEYMRATYEQAGKADTSPEGYYVMGTFFVFPWLELGARWDRFTADADAQEVSALQRATFSLGFYLNPVNRISLNYELRQDDARSELGDLIAVQVQGAL